VFNSVDGHTADVNELFDFLLVQDTKQMTRSVSDGFHEFLWLAPITAPLSIRGSINLTISHVPESAVC
jgi:hypothetical protein